MIWMYGQAPSAGDPPGREAFRGKPHGTFLATLAAVTETELREHVRFLNVLTEYPGHGLGKGDDFPLEQAEREADVLMEEWRGGDRVIFAGRRVAEAFGFRDLPWFEWRLIHRERPAPAIIVALFPHPSRVNRFWNDPENVKRASVFMQALVS